MGLPTWSGRQASLLRHYGYRDACWHFRIDLINGPGFFSDLLIR
jgi:hypothetical protein